MTRPELNKIYAGNVLDPFMGSGTTAIVAARLNRNFLGIELNPIYARIAGLRAAPEVAQAKFL
jgi:DNA modification methylase